MDEPTPEQERAWRQYQKELAKTERRQREVMEKLEEQMQEDDDDDD